jgi:PAS domain S-box-containing protein
LQISKFSQYIEENLNNGNILLQAVKDSSNHVIITDANGQIIFANPRAEQNTGFLFSEMKGSTPRLWGGLMPQSFYDHFWKNHDKKKALMERSQTEEKMGKYIR